MQKNREIVAGILPKLMVMVITVNFKLLLPVLVKYLLLFDEF
jgi:hypothetical protein